MLIERKKTFVLITGEENTFSDFFNAFLKDQKEIEKENIVVQIPETIKATSEDFFSFVNIAEQKKQNGTSFVLAALNNNNFKLPGKKIIINMAPADIRKEGAAYDLTLAIGILAASNQIKSVNIHQYVIMGELSLDGSLQSIRGALPMAIKAREEGFNYLILPKENAKEAAIVSDLEVLGV